MLGAAPQHLQAGSVVSNHGTSTWRYLPGSKIARLSNRWLPAGECARARLHEAGGWGSLASDRLLRRDGLIRFADYQGRQGWLFRALTSRRRIIALLSTSSLSFSQLARSKLDFSRFKSPGTF